jgi:hypothetical protein
MNTSTLTNSNGNLNRIARSSFILIAIAAALVGAAGAKADTIFGNVGQYTDRGAACYHNGNYNQVIVQPPNMSSSPVNVANNGEGITFNVGGGAYGGGFHVQYVAYRAYIKKWNAATRAWDYITAGTWRFSRFGDVLSPAIGWYNLDGSGDSEGGSTFFNINQPGYYQVDLLYYWWADDLSGAGAAWNTVTSYDGNQYCAF